MEIYRRLRPGEPPTEDTARNLFNNLFFNPERYDLSRVGRLKLNFKFGLDEPLETGVLTKRDILEVVRYLIELKNGRGTTDDIDHLYPFVFRFFFRRFHFHRNAVGCLFHPSLICCKLCKGNAFQPPDV